MAHVEQQLLSRIVRSGDVARVLAWGITENDFVTTEGLGLFRSILGYYHHALTQGAVRGPIAMIGVFPTFALCDDTSMTTEALCHEVRLSRIGSATKEAISEANELIGYDTRLAVQTLLSKLQAVSTLSSASSALARLSLWGRKAIVELAERQVSYVWEPVASEGWFVLLAGAVAGGKTSLAFLLAIARANVGEPVKVLGRLVKPAPPGTGVVLLEGEVDEVASARKLRRSCRLLGVDESALDRICLVARKGVTVGDPAWEGIEAMIRNGQVSDVFIDTIARVAPGESNSEEAQASIFDRIAKSVELAPTPEKKPVVWALAHTRKGASGGLDDVLGSVQRTAQIDSALILEPRRDGSGRVTGVRTTFAKLRHDPPEHPQPILMTINGDHLEVTGIHVDARTLEERIRESLSSGPLTLTQVGKRVGRNHADVREAIERGVEGGFFMRTDVKTTRGTHPGVALAPGNK